MHYSVNNIFSFTCDSQNKRINLQKYKTVLIRAWREAKANVTVLFQLSLHLAKIKVVYEYFLYEFVLIFASHIFKWGRLFLDIVEFWILILIQNCESFIRWSTCIYFDTILGFLLVSKYINSNNLYIYI